MDVLLIGAGGHAKAVVEAVRDGGNRVAAYVDPHAALWLSAPWLVEDDPAAAGRAGAVVMGLGGTEPEALARRLALLDRYLEAGLKAPAVIHGAAHVSADAVLAEGVIVLAGAVVQPGASLARGALVNTGAVVEHDGVIGPGSHIAPGAVVLGGGRIGACCMIGAVAVILPAAQVPDRSLVPALTRYPAPARHPA